MRRPTRLRPSRVARALVATAVVVVAVATQRSAEPAEAQAAPSFRVEVDTTAALVDGQQVEVRLVAEGDRTITSAQVKVCRDDATYAATSDSFPFTGKCPGVALSSSASPNNDASLHPVADQRTAIGRMRIGTGRVRWGPTDDADRFELTCDSSHPCRLVVFFRDGAGREAVDASTRLTFADDDPLAGCGGTAAGALTAAGPDRFIDTWARLTRLQCAATGRRASSNAVLTGEGTGLTSFHAGTADLAYSGVGPVLGSRTPAAPRGSTSVPIGLNAVVIGVLGGYPSSAADWPSVLPRPYDDVRLTADEMATLFGNSTFVFDAELGDAVRARNPQLSQVLRHATRGVPVAPGNADGTVWIATRWFDTVAGDAWRSAVNQSTEPDTPRGVVDELAAASPPFEASFVELYTQRAGLKKALADPSLTLASSFGAQFVLTDLATARQLGIPTAALRNRRGEFVQPTDASLAAAVSSMQVRADGTVLPVASPDAAGAYPLAYVEHAVAPTEPLLTDTCAPREASQVLLTSWLEYVVGDAQDELGGLVPLTPGLAAVAEVAIGRVGVADPTGECGPDEQQTETPGATPPGGLPGGLPPGVPGGIPSVDTSGPGGLPVGRPRNRCGRAGRRRCAPGRPGHRGRGGGPRRRGRRAVPARPARAARHRGPRRPGGHGRPARPRGDGRGGGVAHRWPAASRPAGGIVTLIVEPGVDDVDPDEPVAGDDRPEEQPLLHAPIDGEPRPLSRARIGVLVVAWIVVTLLGIGLVLTDLGRLVEARDQRSLLASYRTEIRQKSEEAYGLPGIEVDTAAPAPGDPVAIVDVPGEGLRQVVVEGTQPGQTRRGPGHVVGTAGPGQPGNSVVVGRRRLFGGPFSSLGDLREGDEIVVTTTQGQSLYVVGHVGRHRIRPTEEGGASSPIAADQGADASDAGDDDGGAGDDDGDDALLPEGDLTEGELYGPSADDRLTLVTSAGGSPWSTDRATVVVAGLDGRPFPPTPQGGRTPGADGRGADPDAIAPLVLALLAYAAAVATAVWAYRRLRWRSAYLLSAPLLLALTIVLAEHVARTLPAWS